MNTRWICVDKYYTIRSTSVRAVFVYRKLTSPNQAKLEPIHLVSAVCICVDGGMNDGALLKRDGGRVQTLTHKHWTDSDISHQ